MPFWAIQSVDEIVDSDSNCEIEFAITETREQASSKIRDLFGQSRFSTSSIDIIEVDECEYIKNKFSHHLFLPLFSCNNIPIESLIGETDLRDRSDDKQIENNFKDSNLIFQANEYVNCNISTQPFYVVFRDASIFKEIDKLVRSYRTIDPRITRLSFMAPDIAIHILPECLGKNILSKQPDFSFPNKSKYLCNDSKLVYCDNDWVRYSSIKLNTFMNKRKDDTESYYYNDLDNIIINVVYNNPDSYGDYGFGNYIIWFSFTYYGDRYMSYLIPYDYISYNVDHGYSRISYDYDYDDGYHLKDSFNFHDNGYRRYPSYICDDISSIVRYTTSIMDLEDWFKKYQELKCIKYMSYNNGGYDTNYAIRFLSEPKGI